MSSRSLSTLRALILRPSAPREPVLGADEN
jgi:hypothetical protein